MEAFKGYGNIYLSEEREVLIYPKFGRMLYSWQEVEKGVKLTLWTDLFFQKREEVLLESIA